MKKQIYFFIACTIFSMHLISQSTGTKQRKFDKYSNTQPAKNFLYNFSVQTGTYTDLTGAISLNNDSIWDDPDFIVPLPFAFVINGHTISNELIFDGLGAELIGVITPSALYELLLPFACDLIDRGYDSGTSLSPLSYKVEGNTGSRILKIEWKNVGSYDEGEPYSMYMNFQMWLYESTNVIEYHYGPGMINNPAVFYYGEPGPLVGVATIDDVNYEFLNIHFLNGPAASPVLSVNLETISGTPANGTIYRFSPLFTNIESDYNEDSKIFITPNPSSEFIKINNLGTTDSDIKIYDLTGRVVLERKINAENNIVEISHFQSGIYLLNIRINDSEISLKIIKH